MDDLILPDWYNPDLHSVSSTGSIHDRTTGRIIGNVVGGGQHAITPATAGQLHDIRRQKIIEAELAAGRGLAAAARTPDYIEAWSKIIKSMAELAMDPGASAAGRVKAAELAGRAAGLTGPDRSDDPGSGRPAVQISLNGAAVERLKGFIAAARDDRRPRGDDL